MYNEIFPRNPRKDVFIYYSLLKQRDLLTIWFTKCKVILIIVVATVTKMKGNLKCRLILRKVLVALVTK